jgi:hypothetical protein
MTAPVQARDEASVMMATMPGPPAAMLEAGEGDRRVDRSQPGSREGGGRGGNTGEARAAEEQADAQGDDGPQGHAPVDRRAGTGARYRASTRMEFRNTLVVRAIKSQYQYFIFQLL